MLNHKFSTSITSPAPKTIESEMQMPETYEEWVEHFTSRGDSEDTAKKVLLVFAGRELVRDNQKAIRILMAQGKSDKEIQEWVATRKLGDAVSGSEASMDAAEFKRISAIQDPAKRQQAAQEFIQRKAAAMASKFGFEI